MGHLFVTEHGASPGAWRVVCVHGSLDRSAAFARTGRLLADFHVVRYDRRGYGRSIAVGPSDRFDDQVDDLAEIVGETPSVLVGHSLGGVVALAFAQRHPSLALAVVAYEAPMPWDASWPSVTAGSAAMSAEVDPADAAERFMRRMIGDERWEALPLGTREQRRAEGPALVAELRAVRAPSPAPYVAEELVIPVVAAHGTESAPHHQAGTRHLAERAPKGELHKVEGAGHGVALTHPGALADLTRRAVALVEPPG
ncbi:MAG: alpha/beta hydrolase [Acidimicrobiia bacterium]|nr:alpha/beta hydrolase [Acidimicrobiia bacterium]